MNRSLAFAGKSFESRVPAGSMNEDWKSALTELYRKAGVLIEDGHLKEALELIFAHVRRANKYFDEQKPWIQVKQNREACAHTLFTCVQIIANFAQLLHPFLPFSCDKIRTFLSLGEPGWHWTDVPAGRTVHKLELLFERIDLSRIEEETKALGRGGEREH
ncbi:class I tRNA ligase family protein [Paenibacillus allorhizosphaerae]|uniref:Methionine--tRNA ligase n=1 Tax=Paenibacillus allorhizosphaerae TaxID=2849866 RepID=A0ABN7TRZ9_9BACL|nr:Methionine--tRNA ligase [Paenibacillus allorhizosphaerae]